MWRCSGAALQLAHSATGRQPAAQHSPTGVEPAAAVRPASPPGPSLWHSSTVFLPPCPSLHPSSIHIVRAREEENYIGHGQKKTQPPFQNAARTNLCARREEGSLRSADNTRRTRTKARGELRPQKQRPSGPPPQSSAPRARVRAPPSLLPYGGCGGAAAKSCCCCCCCKSREASLLLLLQGGDGANLELALLSQRLNAQQHEADGEALLWCVGMHVVAVI